MFTEKATVGTMVSQRYEVSEAFHVPKIWHKFKIFQWQPNSSKSDESYSIVFIKNANDSIQASGLSFQSSH